MSRPNFSSLVLFLLLNSVPLSVSAATVWATGGPGITTIVFDKPGFADPALVHDAITPLVIIGRADDRGLYNLVTETFHDLGTSPTGTEWAFAGLDGNPATVSAADFSALNFLDWANSLGARFQLLDNIVDRPGVVHLIDDDIYLDITFTAWGGPGSGGSYTYTRTAPIPEPSSALLLVAGGLVLLQSRRRTSP